MRSSFCRFRSFC